MTLAVAESLTGGVMSSRLSEIDRNMDVFKGAVIAGTGDEGTGPERAILAARTAQSHYGTDVGIAAVDAIPSDGQRRGTVYLGIIMGSTEFTELVALPGDRARLRNYAVIGLMNYVRKLLS